MATTTPNFGWTVPTSSDLVKNGAVAIETLGDAIDASLVDLKGGTSGQVLSKASGTDMDFTWVTASAGGGGKVLQVVSATNTTTTVINTTTLTDTGITATITPTASTSKILVIVSAAVVHFRSAGASSIGGKVLRGATTIGDFGADGWSGNFATVSGITLCGSFTVQTWNYLDSPATTSATTYKMQGRLETTASSSSSEWQPGGKPSTITLIEIGA